MLKHKIRILFIIRKSRQSKTNISLCFRLVATSMELTSHLQAASSFSSSFQSLQLIKNHKVNYGLIKSKVQIKTGHAKRCNNRDLIFGGLYITQLNICDGAFIAKIVSL